MFRPGDLPERDQALQRIPQVGEARHSGVDTKCEAS